VCVERERERERETGQKQNNSNGFFYVNETKQEKRNYSEEQKLALSSIIPSNDPTIKPSSLHKFYHPRVWR
jgi:hypothetical protein